MSLALWLRTGRTERGLSLDDVARVTKIQPRILERLEGGKLDGLPAEVFVRGFIRSFARCCGLDEAEALTRYSAASQAQQAATAPVAPSALAAPPTARAMVEVMADLAPQVSRNTPPVAFAAFVPAKAEVVSAREIADVEVVAKPQLAAGSIEIPAATEAATTTSTNETTQTTQTTKTSAVEAPRAPSAKKKRRGGKRAKRKSLATGTPSGAMPIVDTSFDDATSVTPTAANDAAVVDAAPAVDAAEAAPAMPVDLAPIVAETPSLVETSVETSDEMIDAAPSVVDQLDPLVEPPADAHEDIVATEGGTWQPKMPPAATTASVPWRRPTFVATSTAASVPTLVIDDADPDSAEQVLEDREAARSVLTNAQRRSFLPPILLDREDRGARQGGLTLAVIILLIAATLTLSYLMRRPSSSGDGVTSVDVETELVG